MADEFDYAAFVEEHRAKRAEQFRSPMLTKLSESLECEVPVSLIKLYTLGERLLNVPLVVDTESGVLEIQSFSPLTDETIVASRRYGGRYFEFAVGGDSESFLAPIDESNSVCVDHDGSGTDIEATGISFPQIVERLRQLLV